VITADELTTLILAEAELSADPPVSDEALEGAASTALRMWGDQGTPSPISSAA
jgi:hypothetical protein